MKTIKTIAQKNNHNLSSEQLCAASHKSGPALTLAVPGSGKTTLLLYRAAHLILSQEAKGTDILTLTFSKSAAVDMAQRYERDIAPHVGCSLNISTIHSFCYKIVRAFFHHKNQSFSVLSDSGFPSKKSILKSLYQKETGRYLSQDIFEDLSRAISYKKNKGSSNSTIPTGRLSADLFHKLFSSYEQQKKHMHCIDFDDMLTLALSILESHPKTTNYYKNKYPWIQIDEAQDTSSIQNQIINLILSESPNLFLVADDDQSIYGFRGASPDELLNFSKTYPSGKIFRLSQNFRCSHEITQACQQLIENNTHRYKKDMKSQSYLKRPVFVRHFETLTARNHFLLEKNTNESTAILYRNHISALSIIDCLERSGRTFSLRDCGPSLSEHWLVQDIFSFFQLALVPQDIQSFERIAFKMNGFISKAALHHVKKNGGLTSVFDLLLSFPDLHPAQKKSWIRLADQFDNLFYKKPAEAISFLEIHLGYLSYLDRICQNSKTSLPSLRSLLSTLKEIGQYTESLFDFIARIKTLDTISKEAQYTSSTLHLSTIHGAKGLEYHRVFLIDIDKGILPPDKAFDENEVSLEEERRLLYVAMSRAKRKLDILQVQFHDGRMVSPSPFLKEIQNNTSVRFIDPPKSQKKTPPSHKNFTLGALVKHTHFGEGRVESLENDSISIRFERGLKKLCLSVCVNNELLDILVSNDSQLNS